MRAIGEGEGEGSIDENSKFVGQKVDALLKKAAGVDDEFSDEGSDHASHGGPQGATQDASQDAPRKMEEELPSDALAVPAIV